MCQSWLHFLMHHQQMWLLWVLFLSHTQRHTHTPQLSSRLTTHSASLLQSLPPPQPQTHTQIHSPLQTPSPHLLLPLLSPPPPPSHFPTSRLHALISFLLALISSTSCLGQLFLALLFLMFALSGIHFTTIYSLVKYHNRVPLWGEKWTAVEKNAYPFHGSFCVTSFSIWMLTEKKKKKRKKTSELEPKEMPALMQ